MDRRDLIVLLFVLICYIAMIFAFIPTNSDLVEKYTDNTVSNITYYHIVVEFKLAGHMYECDFMSDRNTYRKSQSEFYVLVSYYRPERCSPLKDKISIVPVIIAYVSIGYIFGFFYGLYYSFVHLRSRIFD